MSRNRQNNHYHYAEQFSDRRRPRAKKNGLLVPRRAIFFAALMLVIFGMITATFSVSDSESGMPSTSGGLLVKVRNAKVDQDIAGTGMTRDDYAALTGVQLDYAATGATTYYYRGAKNSWGATAMTASADGFYAYYSASGSHQFKIATSNSSWDYNYTYVSSGFNGTNVSQIGDYSQDNCYCWASGAHYIIIYYPSTVINTTNKPKICASTTLPDNSMKVYLGEFFTNSSSSTEHLMTLSSGTWTYSMNLTGNLTRGIYFHMTYNNTSINEYYKDQNEATVTYDHCTDWTFEQNNKQNPKLATIITGSYGFSFNYSTKLVSVTYPKYNVSLSISPAGASSGSLTPSTTTQVSIGSGITISAPTAGSSYDWVNWTVTGGTVKTDSYADGTAMTSNPTRTNLTVYPYGTNATVTLQANYKVKEYTIRYYSDATPATAAANTITNPATNSVPTSQTKEHNANYPITSNTFERASYTQVGWATAANYTSQTSSATVTYYALGANYSGNGNLNLYPVWQLKAPTLSNSSNALPTITGGSTVGTAPVDLHLSVSDESDDVTRSYSYSYTGGNGTGGATVTVGTDPEDDDFMYFTANIPGTYTVTVTVTDTSTTGVINTNQRASATTAAVTITVQPDAPQFTLTAYNAVEDSERDGSTPEKAMKILLGNRYYFSAQLTQSYLNNHPTSSYTYTWATDAAFTNIVGYGASITFTNVVVPNTSPKEYNTALITYDPSNPPTPDPRTLADESHGLESVTMYCRATRNSASNDSVDHYLYYFIQPLIESFDYEPMQKIFNLGAQGVSLGAEYNISNDPTYTTKLFFSYDNNTYTQAQQASGFIATFISSIYRYMYPAGPKYFYLEMTGYNSMHELITSVTEKIHTTVGTADSTTSRVLYFDNSSSLDIKNYLVMCYYIDGSGNLRYQAAQDLNKGDENAAGLHYRVMIPEDTEAVCFGLLGRDVDRVRYYGSPTISGGVISGFSTPIYYGCTNQLSITDSVRRITANSASGTENFKNFSCTTGSI